MVHKIRIQTSRLRMPLTVEQMHRIAAQINEKAQNRRMIGHIDGAGDRGARIANASHIVLPTATVRGSWIVVEIEIADSPAGRTVKALIEAKVPIRGSLRAVGATGSDVAVYGVDVCLDTDCQEFTVLDDIVDALEESDNLRVELLADS